MRCDIPPSVQFHQVMETRRIPWVSIRQIQRESEAFEVLPQVLKVRVAVVQGSMGSELVLDQDLETGTHFGDNDLGRLSVKVAAKPLKVSTEEHDVASQILFAESWIGRGQPLRGSALSLDLHQTWHAIVYPVQQRRGWHDLLRMSDVSLQRSTLRSLLLYRGSRTPTTSREKQRRSALGELIFRIMFWGEGCPQVPIALVSLTPNSHHRIGGPLATECRRP